MEAEALSKQPLKDIAAGIGKEAVGVVAVMSRGGHSRLPSKKPKVNSLAKSSASHRRRIVRMSVVFTPARVRYCAHQRGLRLGHMHGAAEHSSMRSCGLPIASRTKCLVDRYGLCTEL